MNEEERGPAAKQKPRTAQKRTTTIVTPAAASATAPPGAMAVALNTPGRFAIVDDNDFEFVSRFGWYIAGRRYAGTKIDGNLVLMHRLVMGAQPSDEVDHRNGDPLDNRTANLRFCLHRLNMANRGPASTNKWGYKGVYKRQERESWRAKIKVSGRAIQLGDHRSPEDAARAYDKAAREHFGEFAYLNFPEMAS
jgi:hypothetical protein